MAGCRVQVSVRVRPVGYGDGEKARVVVHGDDADPRVVRVEESSGARRTRRFVFDNVFFDGQDEVYDVIGKPMLQEAYNGFNVCLFAYGQTGSGKTHSLLGNLDSEERLGVVPRFVRDMFEEAQRRVEDDSGATIKFTVSMVEIYMEKVRDLLAGRTKGQEPESLDICEDSQRRVFVRGAGLHPVLSVERMMALLVAGNRNRQTAETRMNETSSRSHAIFQITVSQTYDSVEKKDLESVVTFVDLAGSERQAKTESSGMQLEEAKKINHSLLMLGRALNSFSDRRGGDAYISLRESKLTRLLSESFGGNSKTWMLATVSPSGWNVAETLSTLEYARNAMAITNAAQVNRLGKKVSVNALRSTVGALERRIEQLRAKADLETQRIERLKEHRDYLAEVCAVSRTRGELNAGMSQVLENMRLRNDALRSRVVEGAIQELGRGDGRPADVEEYFYARGGIALDCVLVGRCCSFELALTSRSGAVLDTALEVQLFPARAVGNSVSLVGGVAPPLGAVSVAANDETGPAVDGGRAALDFFLHVVGARNIPERWAGLSLCLVSLRHDVDERRYESEFVHGDPNPQWNLVQRFEISGLSPEEVHRVCASRFFTFEVFGFSTSHKPCSISECMA